MEIRRIFQAGNSLVIAVPPSMKDYLGWKKGDQVLIQLLEGGKITVQAVTKELKSLQETGVARHG